MRKIINPKEIVRLIKLRSAAERKQAKSAMIFVRDNIIPALEKNPLDSIGTSNDTIADAALLAGLHVESIDDRYNRKRGYQISIPLEEEDERGN